MDERLWASGFMFMSGLWPSWLTIGICRGVMMAEEKKKADDDDKYKEEEEDWRWP